MLGDLGHSVIEANSGQPGYAELLGLSEPSFPRINKPYFQSQLATEITKALKSRG